MSPSTSLCTFLHFHKYEIYDGQLKKAPVTLRPETAPVLYQQFSFWLIHGSCFFSPVPFTVLSSAAESQMMCRQHHILSLPRLLLQAPLSIQTLRTRVRSTSTRKETLTHFIYLRKLRQGALLKQQEKTMGRKEEDREWLEQGSTEWKRKCRADQNQRKSWRWR